jgi:hypothetical protein
MGVLLLSGERVVVLADGCSAICQIGQVAMEYNTYVDLLAW